MTDTCVSMLGVYEQNEYADIRQKESVRRKLFFREYRIICGDSGFLQRGFNRFQQKQAGLFGIAVIGNVFQTLCFIGLSDQIFECRFHQWVQCCNGFVEIDHADGMDNIFIHINFDIHGLFTELYAGRVDSGAVSCVGRCVI